MPKNNEDGKFNDREEVHFVFDDDDIDSSEQENQAEKKEEDDQNKKWEDVEYDREEELRFAFDDYFDSSNHDTTEEKKSEDTRDIEFEDMDDLDFSDDEGNRQNRRSVKSQHSNQDNLHTGQRQDARGEGFLARFGRWAQENLPNWVYQGFWGLVHLIGKTVRMLVFGEESVTRDAAHSFERTMEAERYKAEKDNRDKEAEKEAKEYAEEAKKEAETAQSKEKSAQKDDLTQQKDNSTKESETLLSRIEKAAMKSGYRIDNEFDSKSTDILRLSKSFPGGVTKDYYIDADKLKDADNSKIEQSLKDAAKIAGAQRYLDNHGLMISAVNNENFIVKRPGGASFQFENWMMRDSLGNVVKYFEKMEATAPKHVQFVAKDMYVPITSATLSDFIHDEKAPVEPERQVIDSNIPIPDIRFTTAEEIENQPYKELTHAGFIATGPDEIHMVRVEDGNGAYYNFSETDYRLNNPEAMKAAFTALERTGVEYDAVCPEVPNDFHEIINNEVKDLLTANNLAMSADEHSDTVHVFARNPEGSIDYGKSWTLSQSGMALGDATDLKKIIFEVDNKEMFSSMESADQYPPQQISDVNAAAKAIGIVSAMRYDCYRFADGETVAVAEIELTQDKGIMYGTNNIEVSDSNSLDSLSFNLNLDYNETQAVVDTKDYIDSLSDAAQAYHIGETEHEAPEIHDFLKEPSDELDHCIAMTMISADIQDSDVYEECAKDSSPENVQETYDFEPFNLDDLDEPDL